MPTSTSIRIYLEIGAKKTFAEAADWPGWSRSGKDQASALQALLDYGPRYAAAIASARLGFQPPAKAADFAVAERIQGDATTDFGTPAQIPKGDFRPADEAELRRLQNILKACWRYFDQAAESAKGRTLRLGPRGGGRDREKIVGHVLGAEDDYLTALGVKTPFLEGDTPAQAKVEQFRKTILKGLAASAHGELPTRGPRGGVRWPARYFVRRDAWHLLDHAWEIEDRVEGGK